MPLYEYQCQQCGNRSEVLQNMGAAPLTTCELCGGALKKLASSPSVKFKGSGWYVTDYARKSGGAREDPVALGLRERLDARSQELDHDAERELALHHTTARAKKSHLLSLGELRRLSEQ